MHVRRSKRISCSIYKIVLPLVVFLILSQTANAATFYSRATGNWTAPATWSQIGYGGAASATYPGQSGAGDVVFISGHTVTVTVTPPNSIGAITLNQLGTAALTKLNLNTTGVVLTCSSFTLGDNNVDQHMELEVSSTARLQVNGAFLTTRSTSNNRNKRVRIYVLGSGRINTTGNFSYTYFRSNGESELEVQLDGSGRIDVGGNLNCTIGESTHGNDRFTLQMNGTSQMNVSGTSTFMIQNTTDGDDLSIDLNGGVYNGTGAMVIGTAATATSSSDLDVQIDGAAMNAYAGLTFTHSGGALLSVLMNSNSVTSAASLFVGGAMNLNHDPLAGNDLIQLNAQSSLLTEGNMSLIFQESGGDNQTIDLNGGTFTVNGNFSQTMTGTGTSHDIFLTIDNNAAMSVGGNMTVTRSSGDDIGIELNRSSGTTARLNVGGSFTVNSTTGDEILISMDGSSTMTTTASLNMNITAGGKTFLKLNENNGTSAVLTVRGDLLIDKQAAASDVEILQKKSSLLQIDGNMNLFFVAGNDYHQYRLNKDLNSLIVGGSIRAELRAGPGTSDKLDWNGLGGTITVTGDVDFLQASGDDVSITCEDTEVFTIGGRLNVQHTGGDDLEFKVDDTASLNVGSDLILNDASTGSSLTDLILASDAIARIYGNLTMTATAGAELLMELKNDSKLFLKGSLLRQAAPQKFGSIHMDNTAYLELNGTANTQVITDDAGNGGDLVGYTNLIVNNSFATQPQITTIGTTSIQKTLTLTRGVIGTTASTLLVINKGATSQQGNASSYVDGPMKKIGKDPFVFPVGNNGRWMRLGIENINDANDQTEFVCKYLNLPSPNNTPPFYGTSINHVSYIEHWVLDRILDAGNDASCNVRLFWENAITSDINTGALADLRVAQFRSSTSKWESQGGTATGSGSGNVVSTIPLSSFGLVTFGSASGQNPLPVELIDFSGVLVDNTVQLDWATASENNNDHFEVERSSDAVHFSSIAVITAVGNSLSMNNYSTIDASPMRGTNYYRLKQVDTDGSTTTSHTIAIQFQAAQGVELFLYPNPGMDDINVLVDLSTDTDLTIELVDVIGRVVLHEQHTITAHGKVQLATTGLPIGTYSLIVRNGPEIIGNKRWVKSQ